MVKIFTFINMRESIEAGREGRNPEYFDASNDEDIARYFGEYLPKRIALNLAKLHSLGITHRFLHNQNVSMAGGIYDLASLRGKGLRESDEAITAEDIRKDFGEFLMGVHMIGDIGKHRGWSEEQQKELGKKSRINLYKTYLENAIDAILAMKILPPPPDFREFQNKAIETIAEEIINSGNAAEDIPDFSERINDEFKDEIVQWLSVAVMFLGRRRDKREGREMVSSITGKIMDMSRPFSSEEVHDLLMEKLKAKR